MASSDASADMLAAQARAKLLVLIAILATLGGAAWWFEGRIQTEPERVMIAIAIGDSEDPASQD